MAALYHWRMNTAISASGVIADLARSARDWLVGWWLIVLFSARLAVLAFSPSSYRGASRGALARHLVEDTAPVLLWFTLLSALVSLVIIHIVVVTSVSYGLTRYALEMVVRVLVLELIPLTAAMFVALQVALPNAVEVAAVLPRDDGVHAGRRIQLLNTEILPRVLSGIFAVLLLAAVSCVVAAVLAYLWVHGFTAGGFAGYTRTFGRIFDPAVTLIFAMKTLGLALAVGLLPVASVLYERPGARERKSAELRGLVRLFFALLVIEVAALVANYL